MTNKILTQTVVIGQALIAHNDKYLLIQEKDTSWFLPAGRIENTESVIQGIEREIMEEAGISATVTGIIRVYHSFFTMQGQKTGKLIFVFEAEPNEILEFNQMRKVDADEETLQSQWFDLEEINNLVLRSPEVLKIIDSYLRLKPNQGILPIEFADFLYFG